MKGIPIRAILEIPREDIKRGGVDIDAPYERISWYKDIWINAPAHINIILLNIAWVIKWKKATLNAKMEIENIIIAICLRVLKAIIFFKSCSQLAEIPEKNIVIEEIKAIMVNDKG